MGPVVPVPGRDVATLADLLLDADAKVGEAVDPPADDAEGNVAVRLTGPAERRVLPQGDEAEVGSEDLVVVAEVLLAPHPLEEAPDHGLVLIPSHVPS